MFPSRRGIRSAILAGGLMLCAATAYAQDNLAADTEPSGLWLMTDYPQVTERIGDDIELDLTLANRKLPPQRVDLQVVGLPEGWEWTFHGGGKPVAAAMVGPDENRSLRLEITPPDEATAGDFRFSVRGTSDQRQLDLPITLTLSEAEPAKLNLEAKLPALRGSPKSSFDFQVTVENDSAEDAVVNLLAETPPGFQAVFKEQYGSQELTSLPIEAGQSKDVKVSVSPPQRADAGKYQVTVKAASGSLDATLPLELDITGQPTLALRGADDRLSGSAIAGEEKSFTLALINAGSAPARNVELAATPPSGWKVEFEPKEIDSIPPGQPTEVTVKMTPSQKAIAGDYMVQLRANGDGVSDRADFRVTVTTSTMWGVAGLGVIAAAVLVLGLAVTRYGRR